MKYDVKLNLTYDASLSHSILLLNKKTSYIFFKYYHNKYIRSFMMYYII